MVLTTTARGQIIATAPGSVGTDPHAPAGTARSRAPPGTHEQAATAAGVPVGRVAARAHRERMGAVAVPAPGRPAARVGCRPARGRHRAGRNGRGGSDGGRPTVDRRRSWSDRGPDGAGGRGSSGGSGGPEIAEPRIPAATTGRPQRTDRDRLPR